MSSGEPIFKIMSAAEWQAAERDGIFAGSPADLADGYIHFSTAAQVDETAARHFAGQSDLWLVAVDPTRLGAALRWEPSRGGDLFPHLYGPLPLDAVLSVREFGARSQEPGARSQEPGALNPEPRTPNLALD